MHVFTQGYANTCTTIQKHIFIRIAGPALLPLIYCFVVCVLSYWWLWNHTHWNLIRWFIKVSVIHFEASVIHLCNINLSLIRLGKVKSSSFCPVIILMAKNEQACTDLHNRGCVNRNPPAQCYCQTRLSTQHLLFRLQALKVHIFKFSHSIVWLR